MSSDDDRIPLRFGSTPQGGPDVALLLEAERAPLRTGFAAVAVYTAGFARHRPSCRCCGGRDGAGLALAQLFLARARGEAPAFTAVAVVAKTEAGRAAVAEALRSDPLASARFRLA